MWGLGQAGTWQPLCPACPCQEQAVCFLSLLGTVERDGAASTRTPWRQTLHLSKGMLAVAWPLGPDLQFLVLQSIRSDPGQTVHPPRD